MPSWCTQGKIDVYPEVYKSSENKLALLILIDEHPTGKYYILGETYHPPPHPHPLHFTSHIISFTTELRM